MPATKAEQSGWYRIRLRASAVNPDSNGRLWTTLRSGACYAWTPSMYWIGALELTSEPHDVVFDAWIQEEHMIQLQPGDYTLERPGYNQIREDPYQVTQARGIAGAAIHSLELERIFPGDSAEEARRRLFGNAEIVRPEEAQHRGKCSRLRDVLSLKCQQDGCCGW